MDLGSDSSFIMLEQPSDHAAIFSNGRFVRHILRFEWPTMISRSDLLEPA